MEHIVDLSADSLAVSRAVAHFHLCLAEKRRGVFPIFALRKRPARC